MTRPSNQLLERVYGKIRELLAEGKIVEAIRFYHEVSFVPLLESKNIVFSMQASQPPSSESEGFNSFLAFLDSNDFGGAAASLCVHQSLSPSGAIAATIRIANRLNVDVTPLDTGNPSLGLSESPLAQQIVHQRATELIKGKAVQGLIKHLDVTEEVAIKIFDKFDETPEASPPVALAEEESDRSPKVNLPLTQPPAVIIPDPLPTQSIDDTLPSTRLERALRRTGKTACIIYGLFALIGITYLAYSYFTSPKQVQPLELREDSPADQQAIQIREWAERTIPKTTTWFFPLSRYISLRLEPGLPAEYSYLELPWDKKLTLLNESTSATISSFYQCHGVLFGLYVMAIVLAMWSFRQANIVAGILMAMVGLLGMPRLIQGFVRLEIENGLWIAPFILPGIVVLTVSIAELAVIRPQSNWQMHRRAFWIGVFVLTVFSGLLGWAIGSGGYLRPNAGLGVLAGLLLVVRHGWGMVRCSLTKGRSEQSSSKVERLLH